MRIEPVEHGDGATEGGNLRQRQIHEDHATFHNMYTQVGVNTRQNKAGDKRRQQEGQNVHVVLYLTLAKAVVRRLIS